MKTKPILAALLAATTLPGHAASDLVNALNTWSGSSQDGGNGATQPAFLTTPPSGLEVTHLAAGFTPTGAFETVFFFPASPDPTPEFPGVKFGSNRGNPSQAGGGDGRNYMRTVETDYYTQDFTAFITVRRPTPTTFTTSTPPNPHRRSVFFGLGTGARPSSGNSPDQATANSTIFLELQNGFGNASRRLIGDPLTSGGANQNTEYTWEPMTTVSSNAIRIRMHYDSVARTMNFAMDYDYDGTFVVDQLVDGQGNDLLNVPLTKQTSEWAAGDRASIFFGGDRSVVFTDLNIDVSQPAAPPTPTALSVASVASNVVNLQWSSFAIPGTTYSVYRSTTAGVFVDPAIATGLTTTSYSDTSVVNGTTYYYRVTQSNTVAVAPESAPSNEVSGTPTASAITPAGLAVFNGGKAALVVDWADILSPFDTYTVRRSTSSVGPFTTIPTGGSGLTESRFLDETVIDGTTYYYTVTSTLAGSESAQSAPASASSRSLEVFVDFNNATPTYSGAGGVAAPGGASWNGIGLGTTANLADSTSTLSSVGLVASGQGTFSDGNGFNVGGDNTTLGSQTLTAPGGYDLMVDYVFENAAGTTTTYTLTGLIPGRKYDLYLYGYGDQLGQNTLFGANGILKQTSNPAGLTTLTQGHHFVTFTAVADVDGKVPFTWRNGFGANDADASSGSAIINGFQLVENANAVLQPFGLSTSGTVSAVDLSWSEVESATSYKVYRSTIRTSGFTLLGSSVSGTYSDTTAIAGVTYYYVVTAVNGAFESFFSEEASGVRTQLIADADLDGLSDADEALIGTNPNDASDFFVAQSSSVTPNAGNYNVSFVINGAPGNYVIERSTTLLAGSWTEVAASSTTFSWSSGTVLTNSLNLSATGLIPAQAGKEFFRAKGVAP